MIDPNTYDINSKKYGVEIEFNDLNNFEDTNLAAEKFVEYAQKHMGAASLAEKAVQTILGDLAIKQEDDKVILPERSVEEVRHTLNEWYFTTAGDANYT